MASGTLSKVTPAQRLAETTAAMNSRFDAVIESLLSQKTASDVESGAEASPTRVRVRQNSIGSRRASVTSLSRGHSFFNRRKLLAVDLSGVPLTQARLHTLTRTLLAPSCNPIGSLNLSNCYVSDNALVDLIAALAAVTTLRSLILARNPLSHAGAEALARYIAEPSCTLQRLDLSASAIGDAGAAALAAALASNGSLVSLTVRHCGITDTGVRALVDATAEAPTVLSVVANGSAGPAALNALHALLDARQLARASERAAGLHDAAVAAIVGTTTDGGGGVSSGGVGGNGGAGTAAGGGGGGGGGGGVQRSGTGGGSVARTSAGVTIVDAFEDVIGGGVEATVGASGGGSGPGSGSGGSRGRAATATGGSETRERGDAGSLDTPTGGSVAGGGGGDPLSEGNRVGGNQNNHEDGNGGAVAAPYATVDSGSDGHDGARRVTVVDVVNAADVFGAVVDEAEED